MVRLNVPPLTRGLLIFVIGLSLAHIAWVGLPLLEPGRGGVPWLVIEPPWHSAIYPWVYLTATLTETNPVGLVIAAATLFFGGRYLERAWGSRDFAAFLLIVALVSNLVVHLLYVLAFPVYQSSFP